MAKHTSGNWKTNETIVYVEGDEEDFAICHTQSLQTNAISDYEECLANARLIAAAPELLEALKLSQELLQQVISDLPNPGYGWLQGKADARIIRNRALLEKLEK